jgi:hypothetical protein
MGGPKRACRLRPSLRYLVKTESDMRILPGVIAMAIVVVASNIRWATG